MLGQQLLWLVVTAGFILLNAFFVATEFALVASRRSRIQELVQEGHSVAPVVAQLQSRIDRSISGTQLGISICSLALGWIGANAIESWVDVVANMIPGMHGFVLPKTIAFLVAFFILMTVQVVLGEQVPKFLSLKRSERIVMRVARPFKIYCTIAAPVIWLMSSTAGLVLKVFRVEKPSGAEYPVHTPEELRIVIEASRKGGELNDRETDLLKRVLNLSDITVEQCMVPHMDAIASSTSFADVVKAVSRTKHSRLPVYEGDRSHIIGVLYARDLFDLWSSCVAPDCPSPAGNNQQSKLVTLVRPPFFVDKDTKANVLLDELRRRKLQIAIITSEGSTALGMVTMEDLIERLVGDIFDEYDKHPARPR